MDDTAAFRVRCSELELQLAQSKEEVLRLQSETVTLLRAAERSGVGATTSGSDDAEDKFSMQKKIVSLTDQLEASDAEVTRLRASLASVESSLNSEVAKIRDEGERQSLFLRSQLLEAKELNSTLQEKLVAKGSTAEAMSASGMDSFVTTSILVSADAVLQRLLAEKPVSSFKAKFDVVGEVSGRTIVLRGKKMNVQLVKAEVLEVLNAMYASMAISASSSTALVSKSKDQSRNAEVEHLRRTVSTYESTVSSLHTALHHAQEKAHEADEARQKAIHERVLADERWKGQCELLERRLHECTETILSRDRNLIEAEETNQLALESLKAEARVTNEFRSENEKLKAAVQQAVDAKELAERSAYSAREQSRATQFTIEDLTRQSQTAEAERRRADALEAKNRTITEELDSLRRAATAATESNAMERGKQSERFSLLQKESTTMKGELKDAQAIIDQLKAELHASQEVASELRRRTTDGRRHDGGLGKSDAAARLASLEEENVTLRRELQQAFDDLRAIAGAMKDSRSVRERAVREVDDLEAEKAKLVEERQALEVALVKERMQAKTNDAELQMALSQAREEAAHQRRRAEMLHEQYQKRMQEVLGAEDKPNDSSKLPRPTPTSSSSRTPTRLVSAR